MERYTTASIGTFCFPSGTVPAYNGPMQFSTNHYLNWYLVRANRGDDAVNLHSSGMAALDPTSFHPDVGNPWTLPHRFEEAVAEWLDIPPDEVVATEGATGGNLLALLTLVEPGKEVLVESPMYEPMLRQAERTNRVKRFHRRPEDGWALPMEEIVQAVGPETGAVMLLEPCNPGGTHSRREDVLALADEVGRHGGWLLVNEVYRQFSDHPTYHKAHPRIVVMSSLSKLAGTYWMRLGWLSASADVCRILTDARFSHGTPTMLGCAYGLEVVPKLPALREAARSISVEHLDHMAQWVSMTPGLEWTPPQGPGFASIALPEGIDDLTFAERLHDELGVLLVPGSLFEVSGSIRVSWLQAGNRLSEGLEGISTALKRGFGRGT